MKSILVATDFSERSDRAIRRATLLAKQTGAALTLIHVVDDDQPGRIVDTEREVASRLLNEQTATLASVDGVSCTSRVVLESPFAGIVQAVRDDAPDLLVIGPHRRQALRDVFIGTTAERTIRTVNCPVLMANAPPVGQYRKPLLTSDLSDCSRTALERYASLGISGHASLSILHVFDVPALGTAMTNTNSRDHNADHLRKEQEDPAHLLPA